MAEDDNNSQSAIPPAADGAAAPQGPQFALQRIYLKDSSYESPRTPVVFQAPWQPKINFDIKTRSTKVQDEFYEAVLTLTVEAENDSQPAFLVEVHQAGVFTCRDFPDEQLEQLLATVCPTILFPYAREAIDALVTKGSFPPIMVAPINFDLLYQQQKQASEQQAVAGNGDAAAPAPENTQ